MAVSPVASVGAVISAMNEVSNATSSNETSHSRGVTAELGSPSSTLATGWVPRSTPVLVRSVTAAPSSHTAVLPALPVLGSTCTCTCTVCQAPGVAVVELVVVSGAAPASLRSVSRLVVDRPKVAIGLEPALPCRNLSMLTDEGWLVA